MFFQANDDFIEITAGVIVLRFRDQKRKTIKSGSAV